MEEQLQRAIGSALRQVRQKHDITQEEAAEQIGITVEHYARIERGQALPGLVTFARIAVVMDVSADVLLARAKDKFLPGADPPSWFIPAERKVRKQLRRLYSRLAKVPPEVVAALESVLRQLERFVERTQTKPKPKPKKPRRK